MLDNLALQSVMPFELVLVDGAPPEERETEETVRPRLAALPYRVQYLRHSGGTAIQRNVGIEIAQGEFVAFIDDDIRLEKEFFSAILAAFAMDSGRKVGGIVGYRTNEHFDGESRGRWRWYRRFRLLTTFEPGRYDFQTGYPINANLQPPFAGVRPVDFMTTSCAVWRREVIESGLRFHPFFRDYGVLEDAHFSLTAGKKWVLWQCGDARCLHAHSARGRANRRRIGYKCVVNYYYVFNAVAGPLTFRQKRRFWIYQVFEFLRILVSGFSRRRPDDWQECLGRLEGLSAVVRRKAW